MDKSHTVVIVGASLAGAAAAEELRKHSFAGRIVLVGAEKHYPYIRPPLSKDYLAGKAGLDDVFVHSPEWYDDNDIEEHLGTTVDAIDRAAHTVTLSNSETFHYDKLLLTTGSRPRTLDIPGADLPGVHYLRTLDDSQALRDAIGAGDKQVAVVGSGWIGMEIAATARALGNDVRVLLRGLLPLSGVLGDELGEYFAALHRKNGVVLRSGVEVSEIVAKDGAAAGVRVGASDVFGADVVVIGIGASPNVELAEAAGLDVDNGILVDESLRTSDPDIFAAGDVANAMHPVIKLRLRSEHWANAQNQGPAAARAMLGQKVSFDDIPYFYTDQFDLGMEYSGYGPLTRSATVVYRGNRDSGEFIAFWVADGKVVAGMNVNVWDVNESIQGIIRRGNRVDLDKLADPSVDLGSL